MSWPAAQANLLAMVELVEQTNGEPLGEDRVFLVPPFTLDILGPFVMLAPPGRDFERRPGRERRGTYRQQIRVMCHLPPGSVSDVFIEECAEGVDYVVEGINDALDQRLKLTAVDPNDPDSHDSPEAVVVAPPSWAEMTVQEYPEDSGRTYLIMQASLDIEIAKHVPEGFKP